jgi:GlpG protein
MTRRQFPRVQCVSFRTPPRTPGQIAIWQFPAIPAKARRMRTIGTLPTEEDASRFGAALYVRGVENDVESEDDGSFSIWVHDDSQLETARALLTEYRANPQAEAFAKSTAEADRARAKAEKEDRKRAANIITRERMEYERTFHAFTWLPILLIICSVAVALQSESLFNSNPAKGRIFSIFSGGPPVFGHGWLKWLHIQYPIPPDHALVNLANIREGQVWRLFTPMFIHYGLLHLIFNMMWLRDLGSFMQIRFGTFHLAALILVSEGLSTVAQYLVSGPTFGGMSGVNYALFGFLWIRSKCDRFVVWQMNPVIIQTMLVWFVVCLTGLLGPIANTSHFVGLVVGAAWGYLSAKISSWKRAKS